MKKELDIIRSLFNLNESKLVDLAEKQHDKRYFYYAVIEFKNDTVDSMPRGTGAHCPHYLRGVKFAQLAIEQGIVDALWLSLYVNSGKSIAEYPDFDQVRPLLEKLYSITYDNEINETLEQIDDYINKLQNIHFDKLYSRRCSRYRPSHGFASYDPDTIDDIYN